VKRTWRPTFGALLHEGSTTFRVWSSAAQSVAVALEGTDGRRPRRVALERMDANLFEARIEAGGDRTLYRYLLDGQGPYPDPASRFQPHGVHGPSQVVDWTRHTWTDLGWRGVRFEDLVVYELHVGTFTRPGSFLGIVDRLAYLVDLGVTAIELMPVAAFPGRRNWGYDGVALFAPACEYGRPEDLRHLVDSAHRAGLAVLLDVVYNHLGPDGAYLCVFSPDFLSPHHASPWGKGINLDGPGSAMVRRFLVENALHWIVEYHIDGLRLDATHALADEGDRHFLAELADTVHGLDLGRRVHVIAEDERNLATLVRRPSAGGMGLDGVSADDFHHQMHRLLARESEGYYADYAGGIEDVATTINRGWFYTGQHSTHTGGAKGSDARDVDRQRFVFCLQNHDQVGNRALGERLTQLTDLPSCRAAAALLLLVPETPLLFMGEEWAASTPFLYFTDHHDELGRLVTEGRRREFARFQSFPDPDARTLVPDPQDERTFESSRLDWHEIGRDPHASMRRLYRALLALRGRDARLADGARDPMRAAHALDADTICVTRRSDGGDLLLVARFTQGGRVELPATILERTRAAPHPAGALPAVRQGFSPAGALPVVGRGFSPAAISVEQRFSPVPADAEPWDVVLTTEDPPFAPDAAPPRVTTAASTVAIEFARPSAVIFRRRS
jgi:maltooligosyltrehalose trehalohydrolase